LICNAQSLRSERKVEYNNEFDFVCVRCRFLTDEFAILRQIKLIMLVIQRNVRCTCVLLTQLTQATKHGPEGNTKSGDVYSGFAFFAKRTLILLRCVGCVRALDANQGVKPCAFGCSRRTRL